MEVHDDSRQRRPVCSAVDGRGARTVFANRLLDNDARARGRQAFGAEALRQRAEQVRTGREIVRADAVIGAKQRLSPLLTASETGYLL